MTNNTKQKVLNLYGGPGSGKSTLAAAIFAALKMQDYNVELVREYAKDLVWEHGCIPEGVTQVDIFDEQARRQSVLKHKVDLIITDSPLMLSTVYGTPYELAYNESLYYDNYNLKVKRLKKYNPNGRLQTLDEAIEYDNKVTKFCEFETSYKDYSDIEEIVDDIEIWLNTGLKHTFNRNTRLISQTQKVTK